MSSLPQCLRWEGVGDLGMTPMLPVSPFFAHHTASDNSDLPLWPVQGRHMQPQAVTSGSRDICRMKLEPWTIQRSSLVTGTQRQLFVGYMWPFISSSLHGRRDGGWNELPSMVAKP